MMEQQVRQTIINSSCKFDSFFKTSELSHFICMISVFSKNKAIAYLVLGICAVQTTYNTEKCNKYHVHLAGKIYRYQINFQILNLRRGARANWNSLKAQMFMKIYIDEILYIDISSMYSVDKRNRYHYKRLPFAQIIIFFPLFLFAYASFRMFRRFHIQIILDRFNS